ncbi:alpha-L-fucosidase [Dysgonomonas sp. Marseille-P4677]|uniref:alpha-L-fucosidase n=1 Tax=Dysgonomonas sp. Marseille-P4677 TaxID=2364790 RepID=UPI001914A094|nr:alpha-L-fucosidase [Dysgonomonas sp. Marseille-P4677]MBK5719959.1 alpha-L-fucosidase [Dysgonomonas sp. Marseille-P4677]
MKIPFKTSLFIILFLGLIFSCKNEKGLIPYGALPSPDQLKWQQMEYYMFIHFGPNTFTDVEWGDGKEDPKVFNPTDLDCRQWAATAKAAGMKGIIITAKHHDGFCLWPSKYSTHTVRESPWKDGKGDILKELSEACREYDLKFGVYLSPWDQNHPAYGTPEYNQVFANTLNEVLSNYGEVFEQWFDGANGEGKDGKRQVYDWSLFHNIVYRNQPHAIIFSDVGPGCRWMGNERGIAGETNWSTLNIEGFEPGAKAPSTEVLNRGEQGGKAWVPAETDVSIRPGWFYSPSTDDKVKTVDELMNIYYTSIGRNSNLLLNVPPDRRGRIHPTDSIRLMEFRKAIEEEFKDNLMKKAEVKSNADSQYDISNIKDEDYDTYWASADGDQSPSIEINFKTSTSFNRLLLQEYIPLGQRVSSFNVKYWSDKNNDWSDLVEATTIGYKRILRFPTVETKKIKIDFNALASPVISTIEVFKASEQLSAPIIERDKSGMVVIKCKTPDPSIYYTIDGSNPSVSSVKYNKPFLLSKGGIVKAIAMVNDGGEKSDIVSESFDIAPEKWSVVSPSSEGVSKIIDGNKNTSVEVGINDALVIDLGEVLNLKGFTYTPVANVQASNISRYDFLISIDGKNWDKVKSNAIFNNMKNNPVIQNVWFDKVVNTRYLKLSPTQLTTGGDKYKIAELGIITR